MDVQIIQKIFQQQKYVNIFIADIQCEQFWDLKINILYTVEKSVLKSFVLLLENT